MGVAVAVEGSIKVLFPFFDFLSLLGNDVDDTVVVVVVVVLESVTVDDIFNEPSKDMLQIEPKALPPANVAALTPRRRLLLPGVLAVPLALSPVPEVSSLLLLLFG